MHSISRRALTALLVASLALGTMPVRGEALGRAARSGAATGANSPVADSPVGVLAAIGCGLGMKFSPAVIGVGGPGWTAAVIGMCLLMITDAMGEKDP